MTEGFRIFCFVLVVLKGCGAIEWEPFASKVREAVGGNLSLPWTYALSPSEHLISLEWTYGPSDQVIATYRDGHFNPAPGIPQRLTFRPNAGLDLTSVTPDLSGNYTVQVHFNFHGNEETSSKTIQVEVTAARDCSEVRLSNSTSGVWTIYPDSGSPLTVYCDQDTDGGGWTVFQRRKDASVDFNRSWTEYVDGFGNASGEYWLGLANIYRLTSTGNYDLRVDLTDFDNSEGYALYEGFRLGGPDDDYTLRLDGYLHGTAGDGFRLGLDTGHNNQPFSTADHYHDQNGTNCAEETHAGWWYNACYWSVLNGVYGEYIIWFPWHDDWRWYKTADMKIRPRQ